MKLPDKNSALEVRGARENNLKDLSVDIPHDSLVVVTGLSGSGKSSLAFDTVYAEGQRRYIETFSTYTRQFFDKVKKPDVDSIEHVRPAIAIEQRTRITNSRSTVGSMTDINDYLKVLWSNCARAVCPECGVELRRWTPADVAAFIGKLVGLKPSATYLICATVKSQGAREAQGVLDRLGTLGYSRYFNVERCSVELLADLDSKHLGARGEVLVVLDRSKASQFNLKRLRESVEQAYTLGDGVCRVIESNSEAGSHRRWLTVRNSPKQQNLNARQFTELVFKEQFACENDDIKLDSPKPAIFSFNHPLGACPACRGFGNVLSVSPELCVPDPSLTIKEKALHCWSGAKGAREHGKLLKFCQSEGIPIDVPWRNLSPKSQEEIFNHKSKQFVGVRAWFKHIEKKIYKMHVRVFISRYRGEYECGECGGSRLKKSALAYRIGGLTIADCWKMSLSELAVWVKNLEVEISKSPSFSRNLKEVFSAIGARLQYLNDLGLSYLTLDRQARTLSGGETQRVNLATALGSELISTHFVLDEPSVGLHPRDTARLIGSLERLCTKGNSVLVVEHDLDCIRAADHIVEMGPGAGETGGSLVYSGPATQWPAIVYREPATFPVSSVNVGKKITISDATARNLKNISVSIPLGQFVCLTGVSGSGKTTLVHEVLFKAYEEYRKGNPEGRENKVTGFQSIDQVLHVDQSGLARSPRANIATYTKMWDSIRERLADTEGAAARKLTKSSFSFNVDAGRCTACGGAGFVREDMQFLSDVYLPCEVCLGKRFQQVVLEVEYRGKNADDFLKMSVDSCADFFQGDPQIGRAAETLQKLGLGHLRLGHSLSELSGGEAQRLKLVPFVEKSVHGNSLLIFDEPTTGLHLNDVSRLIELMRMLRSQGHSILCVEHNLPLIAASDWVIDLGPEGGSGGGAVVAEGTPATVAKEGAPGSATARYLRSYLAGERSDSASERRERPSAIRRAKKNTLLIEGAREHNLRDLTVEVPLDRIVAFTGVSGSGKSTIAKDIIYAEGQRRYLDCLSPYARQYIKELQKPDIDTIENVKPTICVYQHTFQPSRLSTLGTMSEVYNFLRLLYAKTGVQYCPDHPDVAISPSSPQSITEEIKALKAKTIRICAPVIKMKKGHHKAVFERAVGLEISEVRADGVFGAPGKFSGGLERNKAHSIEFVVARFQGRYFDRELVEQGVQMALGLGGGSLIVHTEDGERVFSSERTCSICNTGFFKPDPEDLSFNSRRGRCESCEGHGCTESGDVCGECGGMRLNSLGRNIRLGEKNIHELCAFNARELQSWVETLKGDRQDASFPILTGGKITIAAPILVEIRTRLETLCALGLDTIPLNRECRSLAGGELQRLRLGTAMGTPLSGAMYILDEPSAGLHPFDNRKVLGRLRELHERGNSVVVIEHDPETILFCDHVIDVGPGGGSHGGNIVFSGTPTDLLRCEESVTGQAISAPVSIPSHTPPQAGSGEVLSVQKGSCNNIKDISISLPLKALTTIAGVSGSGKSSLLHGIITDTILSGKVIIGGKKGARAWSRGATKIQASSDIERVLVVDQKPIGKNSRSTPVSYLGLWDEIRKLFASSIEAKERGWGGAFFSYNTGKGRCSECQGQGRIKLEMGFLAEAWVLCEACNGTRFSDDAKSIRYLGVNASDVLKLTFEQARGVFANHRRIHEVLHHTCELGLGYLTLGQSSSTLSGGESQRIKLVAELGLKRQGHTLYVLDEPTTGLHKADVAKLVKSLRNLVSRGNSVIVIEHDPDMISGSDHVIEMGPGGGELGGRVVFEGPPQDLFGGSTPWGTILSGADKAAVHW